MTTRALLAAAALLGATVFSPAAFAQTYVAPGGSPVATAPGGSSARPTRVVPDAWTTGTISEPGRPAASRGTRVPDRSGR